MCALYTEHKVFPEMLQSSNLLEVLEQDGYEIRINCLLFEYYYRQVQRCTPCLFYTASRYKLTVVGQSRIAWVLEERV